MTHKLFQTTEQVVQLPIGRLLNNPLNDYLRGDSISPESCAELTASVRENGINIPLLVTPYRDAFRIVCGHRRRLAGKLADLAELPCIIKELDDDQQFTIMFNENVQRKDLTLRGEARCYKKLFDEGKTLPDIERKTGISKSRIKLLLTVLTLEPEVQEYFDLSKLPIGSAPHLARLIDRDTQIYLSRTAAKQGWTVKTIELKVNERTTSDSRPSPADTSTRKKKHHNSLLDRNGDRQTKSQALALFNEEETFTLRDITRAILGSCCDTCDETRFPKICAECPLSQMLATLLEIKGVLAIPALKPSTDQLEPENDQLN